MDRRTVLARLLGSLGLLAALPRTIYARSVKPDAKRASVGVSERQDAMVREFAISRGLGLMKDENPPTYSLRSWDFPGHYLITSWASSGKCSWTLYETSGRLVSEVTSEIEPRQS